MSILFIFCERSYQNCDFQNMMEIYDLLKFFWAFKVSINSVGTIARIFPVGHLVGWGATTIIKTIRSLCERTDSQSCVHAVMWIVEATTMRCCECIQCILRFRRFPLVINLGATWYVLDKTSGCQTLPKMYGNICSFKTLSSI